MLMKVSEKDMDLYTRRLGDGSKIDVWDFVRGYRIWLVVMGFLLNIWGYMTE
jgi:hypothetical protein